MKATQVQAKQEEKIVQPCSECGKKLTAPWGRNDYGASWVCSAGCQKLYDQRVVIGRRDSAT